MAVGEPVSDAPMHALGLVEHNAPAPAGEGHEPTAADWDDLRAIYILDGLHSPSAHVAPHGLLSSRVLDNFPARRQERTQQSLLSWENVYIVPEQVNARGSFPRIRSRDSLFSFLDSLVGPSVNSELLHPSHATPEPVVPGPNNATVERAVGGPYDDTASTHPIPCQLPPITSLQYPASEKTAVHVHTPVQPHAATVVPRSALPMLALEPGPGACIPELEHLQYHFSTRPHPYQSNVRQLLPGGTQSVRVVPGRYVEVYLAFSHVDLRCALPFEKRDPKAVGPYRCFQKAAVEFTVQVHVAGEASDGLPPPQDETRLTLRAYTLPQKYWQHTPHKPKNMDADHPILQHVDANGVGWVGSEETHHKHTFRGQTAQEVDISMTPGSMLEIRESRTLLWGRVVPASCQREARFKLDLPPSELEPVHVLVAALVPSGEGEDNIIAAELTVPMLCVGKRLNRGTNTDYIHKATTEKLHYAWDAAIAALYDDKTPRW